MRLDKYLADCGVGTRSEIKKLIRAGYVRVEGAPKISPEFKVDENSAKVYVDGVLMNYRKFVYLMLNKPQGYLSATWDKHKPVVLDLVHEEYLHYEVFPVGRLDIDTVGLCVLTNDGEMAHRILSPTKHVPKTYYAVVDGPLDDSAAEAFSAGMDLGDFTSMPAVLENCEGGCFVTIHEGKFHQVKRMFEKVGNKVEFLKRVQIGSLVLDESLGLGEMRELTKGEIEQIWI